MPQSYRAVWDRVAFPGHAGVVAFVVTAGSALFGAYRALPGRVVARDLRHPDCRIEIIPGDLFEETGSHLVIGFTDLFDTDPSDGRIVDPSSVQGQFSAACVRRLPGPPRS
ncbi:macro domain-containing protein [Actinoplanes sp. NPDC051633]|uniref:macro domain-containing protein n=1 Tax=Actinoplanes sp. NPDC051633 TaxID=3155670 RepID=UPI0034202CCB